MILTKKFRIIYDSDSKEIIFSKEFNPNSTTHVGHGRSSSEFDTELQMRAFIINNNITVQPEKSLVN